MQTEFRAERETPLLVHGRVFEREDDSQPWRERQGDRKGGVSIPKQGPWFEGSPMQLLDRCGVTCTDAKRALDFANLCDGELGGYYYLAEASPKGSEEALIWIMNGLSLFINESKLSFSDRDRVLPADYLLAFCEYKVANKFPGMFAKEIFSELLKVDRFLATDVDVEHHWSIIDGDSVLNVSDLTWDEYEGHLDGGRTPRHWMYGHGSMIRLRGSSVMDSIIADPRFKAVDASEIDAIIDRVLAANPKKVEAARAKPQAVNALIGDVMKEAKGKAPPQVVQEKLRQRFAA